MLLSDSSNSPDKPAASALLTANPLLRYGVALLAVAVTLLARWLLEPVLHHSAQLLLFTLAITVSAWYGGLGPGLVSTALSLFLGVYFFIEPHYSFVVFDPRDLVQLWMFVVIGMSI